MSTEPKPPEGRDQTAYVKSFFKKQVLEATKSVHHPELEVVMVNGKKRLDGLTVNYSFGTLHEIFAEAFVRAEVERQAPQSVLLLGMGAGSVIELLRKNHGIDVPIVAVEFDSEVVRLARAHFGLGRWRDLEVVEGDALDFIARDSRRFDLVVVDLFVDAVVPGPFRTTEFLESLRERMAPGAFILFNLVADTPARVAELHAFEKCFRAVFEQSSLLAIRTNVVLTAFTPLGDGASTGIQQSRGTA